MKLLLIIMALAEGLVGLGLFTIPRMMVSEILNTPLDTSGGVLVARLAGAALIALSIGCWKVSDPVNRQAAIGVVISMLFYNAAAAAVLVHGGLRLGIESVFVWPLILLHGVLALWCLSVLWLAMRKHLAASSSSGSG